MKLTSSFLTFSLGALIWTEHRASTPLIAARENAGHTYQPCPQPQASVRASRCGPLVSRSIWALALNTLLLQLGEALARTTRTGGASATSLSFLGP